MIHRSKNKKILLLIFLVFLIAGLLVFFQRKPVSVKQPIPEPIPESIPEPYRTTLEGKIICLPHKDQSGPQTKECAVGLQTDTGENYVLDTNLMSQNAPTYTTQNRIKAAGRITPIEFLSSDRWQKYDVKGIFSITDSFEVLR